MLPNSLIKVNQLNGAEHAVLNAVGVEPHLAVVQQQLQKFINFADKRNQLGALLADVLSG